MAEENYVPEQPNMYQGKQIILNSDRVLFNARKDSVLIFADKSIGLNTAGTVNIDTTNRGKFIVNSPKLILGMNGEEYPTEPALLGYKTGTYLKDVCQLIKDLILFLAAEYKVTVPLTGVSAPGPNYISSLLNTISVLKQRIGDSETPGEIHSKNVTLI